jgi:hypothetical protein
VGVQVMVGSGTIGPPALSPIGDLLASSYVPAPSGGGGAQDQGQGRNGALSRRVGGGGLGLGLGLAIFIGARTLFSIFGFF